MRLANLVVIDEEETLGELKFSAMRRERFVMDENNKPTEEVRERTYDLRSKRQGMMIQVSIPGTVPQKEFPSRAVVELVNPVFDTVTNTTFAGADVDWFIKADDIIEKRSAANVGNPTGGSSNKPNHLQGQDKAAGNK